MNQITPLTIAARACCLFELEVDRVCSESTLLNGISDAFETIVIDDVKRRSDDKLIRFVGRTSDPVTLLDREDARWAFVRKLAIDPFAELRYKLEAFALATDVEYEVRFLSRMRAQPTRPIVEDDLREMGWEPIKLSALKRDMRIPGRSGASVTLWLGILRWTGPASYITEDDPFYFEDVERASGEIAPYTALPRPLRGLGRLQASGESESENEASWLAPEDGVLPVPDHEDIDIESGAEGA